MRSKSNGQKKNRGRGDNAEPHRGNPEADAVGKRIYDDVESAISDALRDGFARAAGGGASPVRSFVNNLKGLMTRALSDAMASALTGKKVNLGFGGGSFAGAGTGKGGGLFGGGGLGGILGYAGLAYSLFSAFTGGGEKAPITRPEAPTAGTGGGEFGGTRPLYGSRRMQLAQFSSRNINGALQKMSSEGPTVNVEVTLNDKGNFQKEVVTATVKQMGRERRRGLRRHEY